VQLCGGRGVLSVEFLLKFGPFPSMTRLLVGCIEILFPTYLFLFDLFGV
jgi:hypothetical protein